MVEKPLIAQTAYQKNFLDYITSIKGYSNKTKISYQNDLSLFANFLVIYKNAPLDNKSFLEIDITEFRSFFSYLVQKKNLSASSRSRILSSLRSFYKYLKKQGIIEDSAIFTLSFPKIDNLCPRAISQNDIKRIIEYLDEINNDWIDTRNRTLFILTYASGVRISELTGLKLANIHPEYIRIEGKGKKERIIPLLPLARSMIDLYLKQQPFIIKKDEAIFRGIKGGILNPRMFQRIIEQIRRDLNLADNFTPHSIRHSFATHLLENNANLRQVQSLLGHESISSTQKYLKITKQHLLEQFNKHSV